MWRTRQTIQRIAVGVTLAWTLLGAGCKTTVQTHPPIEQRIERMRKQVRQMENQTNENDRSKSDRPATDEVRQ
jgi:predicted Zn-dependent protease